MNGLLKRNLCVLMLFLSGSAGFLLGSLVNGTWQLAVESSQVIAGLVEYPNGNPFYLYHSKAWTLLHQVPAVLLFFGISEKSVCFIVSGFIGSLSFLTVSLFVWVLCRRFVFALACPFVMLLANGTQHFVVYPVWMMGTSNTQGVISTFFIVLVITLLASGKNRIGSVLLGTAPSVHLALGLLCWIIVLVVSLLARTWKAQLKANWKYFGMGAAVTLSSLAFHLVFTYDFSQLQRISNSAAYLHSFVHNWDSHRIPVPWKRTGFLINLAALSIGMFWGVKLKWLQDGARRLLNSLAITAAVGIVCAVISWIPSEKIPSFLIILMPARILEVNMIFFFPLILGLIGIMKNKLVSALLFIAFLIPVVMFENFSTRLFAVAWICLLVIPAIPYFHMQNQNNWLPRLDIYITTCILVFVMFRVILFPADYRPESNEYRKFNLADTVNDNLLLRASKTDGVLLTAADLHLIQLRTRRPVLIDGGQMDIVPYTLEAAPAITSILKEVYGIDYWNPPVESKRLATIQGNDTRAFWESRNTSQWITIHRQYGVTIVMTFSNWKLNLPVVERSKDFLLYQIPSTITRVEKFDNVFSNPFNISNLQERVQWKR